MSTVTVPNTTVLPQPPVSAFTTVSDIVVYEGNLNRILQQEFATIFRAINKNIYTPGDNLATIEGLASVANLVTLANQATAATVWTDVNDGSGSGLDADKLDGQEGTYYQTALGYTPVNKAGDTMSGGLSMGSATVSSATDLSRHIALWGTEVGFSVTPANLNIVAGSGNTLNLLAGSSSALLTLSGSGVVVGSTTGGNPGANKINAADYLVSGTSISATYATIADLASNAASKGASLVGIQDASGLITATTVEGALEELAGKPAPVFTLSYESPQQTITQTGLLTLAHGLGVAPKLVQLLIVCTTANAGFAVGDVVVVDIANQSTGSNTRANSLYYDSTNIYYRFGSDANAGFLITNKTSGSATAITNADWKLIVRAWA